MLQPPPVTAPGTQLSLLSLTAHGHTQRPQGGTGIHCVDPCFEQERETPKLFPAPPAGDTASYSPAVELSGRQLLLD